MPTAPGTSRQPPSRPTRPRDTDSGQPRRSDRRRNSGQQANPNPLDQLDQLFAVEVEAPRRQNSAQRRTEGAGGARTASRSVPVIDLTGEPDSPAVPRNTLTLPRPGAPSMSSSGRSHPRRQMPTNNQPPALNRRDVVSNVVIDLTGDDDAPSARTARQGARPPRPPGHAAIPAHVQPVDLEAEEHRAGPPYIMGMLGQLRRFILPNATGFGVGGLEFVIHNPLGNNRPDFNYQANGYNNGGRAEASNKPAHVPPPKAREGFTRNTSNGSSGGSDELDVLVCPACEKELAYDPDEEGGTSTPGKGGPAPKKARTKKDREEHHFWALKECGHVFCKNCYDTRTKRAATKTSEKSKFRIEPAPSKKILCVVDGCTTEVNKPAAWVGLFL
ncbi:hypothetical protein QBC37DRAFT_281723 [Rhypophila decipiens]|uniref:Cell cycle control protein n=1 Tax=Rhypophila decipiens TaxID=261697 RepID=A0AAN6YFX5_9PEZI|nr:hypothetical protein QBC37DRAFT_281723 [Rhypophila decipiens]